MKVVRKGKTDKPWVGYKATCGSCDAKLKLEKGDRVNFIADPRDGDYYEVKCPECGDTITVSASLF